MKKYRSLFQFGTFYRLRSPFETNETIWMVVSSQKDVAIVGYYRPLQQVNVQYNRVKLLGLDPHKKYHVSIHDIDCYGDELMKLVYYLVIHQVVKARIMSVIMYHVYIF